MVNDEQKTAIQDKIIQLNIEKDIINNRINEINDLLTNQETELLAEKTQLKDKRTLINIKIDLLNEGLGD